MVQSELRRREAKRDGIPRHTAICSAARSADDPKDTAPARR